MISKLFLRLTDHAAFRRLLWKPIYELLAKRFRSKDWSLMNYGYAPTGEEPFLKLEDADEINRYPIQLYYYLASKAALQGRDILEVGSGRGGGAAFIGKYLSPNKVIGLDIAGNAVSLANEYFGTDTVSFVQGSAEKLPFENESFDVVINVESSHTYGSVPRFLKEVKRVLRTGGKLFCADIRTANDMIVFKQQIHASGLTVILEENISEQVAFGIEKEEPIKQKRINENISPMLQGIFKQFAGVKGSKAHIQLKNGQLVYCRFVLVK
jgi:ubiquinone/menaquinone biosynthesis C-methylase UbiE